MCPACIASTAAIIAGVGSAGGLLALGIGRFRRCLQAGRLKLFHYLTRQMT
jgi:hypothetical protein